MKLFKVRNLKSNQQSLVISNDPASTLIKKIAVKLHVDPSYIKAQSIGNGTEEEMKELLKETNEKFKDKQKRKPGRPKNEEKTKEG